MYARKPKGEMAMKSNAMKVFNKIEKEAFEDVLHDAKMELSFTENRNIDTLSVPYRIRMYGVLEALDNVTSAGEKFVNNCMEIIDTRDIAIRDEISKFARSIA